MRIALVCDWYSPRRGGIEAHLSGLASRLRDAGHEVHAITSTPGPSLDDGVRIHRLASPRLPLAEVAVDPSLASVIAEVLRRESIDVVHAHVSIIAPVALAGALAADRLALPAVVTFHSFVPATPLWASIAGFVLGARHWRAAMTAVSSRVRSEVVSFAPDHDFTVLPNAIDTHFWTAAGTSDQSSRLTLVFAGRLQRKKHPERAIEAAAALRRRAPGLAFRLIMCGDGPLATPLRRLADAEGIADVVEFAGWRNSDALREIYRAGHLFLSTATRESFGIAALEARATGLPVAAMRNSAVADFIVDGESGILVDEGRDYAARVAEVALDSAALATFREHNVRVRVPFDWDNAIARHLELYERVTSERAAA